jgi:hypothetical protein
VRSIASTPEYIRFYCRHGGLEVRFMCCHSLTAGNYLRRGLSMLRPHPSAISGLATAAAAPLAGALTAGTAGAAQRSFRLVRQVGSATFVLAVVAAVAAVLTTGA